MASVPDETGIEGVSATGAVATGVARAATGHNNIPIASDRIPKGAHARVRRELNDILYPGALTSRLKRYAAEPAPDVANLTSISERTANAAGKTRPTGLSSA